MKERGDRGYALIISMISLVLLTTLTGVLALNTQSEMRDSRTTRADVQAHYIAETGIEKAIVWFRNNYALLDSPYINTSPGTPPAVTDPLGRTYTTPVSLLDGSAVTLNSASGTATTHPNSYTSHGVSKSNLATAFSASLGSQTVSLESQGSGTFSVMATLTNYSPEQWRIDSVGTFSGKTKAVSVIIERLPLSPYVQAAYTSASPVDLNGNQTIDGQDHDINGNVIAGAGGLPGVAVTSTNPLPTVTGSGEILSNVGGSPASVTSSTTYPDPLPANYPVSNVLDPDVYPYTPAAALGLDPAVYQPYLDSLSTTTIPCAIQGLVVLDRNFPTGSGEGGCDYSGTGVLILHNPRYDPRYFDPADPLYSSSGSPVAGQTAAQYRADPLNQPRYFNYNANNTFKGIVIADSIGEIGPGITGNASILGGIISLDRVNGSVGTGNAIIGYSTAAIENALNSMPYNKQRSTFRHLISQ